MDSGMKRMDSADSAHSWTMADWQFGLIKSEGVQARENFACIIYNIERTILLVTNTNFFLKEEGKFMLTSHFRIT